MSSDLETIEKILKASIDRVSETNRIQPPDSISVPIMQHLSYIEDGNILIKLFQNLLARAMDKTRNSETEDFYYIRSNTRETCNIELTEFGELFLMACF